MFRISFIAGGNIAALASLIITIADTLEMGPSLLSSTDNLDHHSDRRVGSGAVE